MIRRSWSVFAAGLLLASGIGGTSIVELTYFPCGDTPVFCFGEPRECDGLINSRGEILHRFKLSHRIEGPFNEGLIAARFPGSERWGYLDTRGRWAIQPTFRRAWPFRGELARVEEEGSRKEGFIDKSGEYVIAPRYEEATDFDSDGFARFWSGDWRSADRRMGVINRSGEIVIEPDGQFFIGEFEAGVARAILVQEACWAEVDRDRHVPGRQYFGISRDLLYEHENYDEFPACAWRFIGAKGAPISKERFYEADSTLHEMPGKRQVFKMPNEPDDAAYCHGLQQVLLNYDSGSKDPNETGFVDRKGRVVFAWKWRW